jgi:MFS family permease
MAQKSSFSRFSSQFHSFWLSSLFSNFGDGLSLLLFPLLATHLTTEPFVVGVLLSIHRIPWFLFALVFGSIIDWLDKYRVQHIAHMSRCVLFSLLSVLLFFNSLSIPLLGLFIFCIGVAEACADTAAAASLPSLVPVSLVERANGRLSVTQTVATEFAGPLIAGLAFAASPIAGTILLATNYICASYYISRASALREYSMLPNKWMISLIQDIKLGVHWFYNRPILPMLAIKGGIENFSWALTTASFILIASDYYRLPPIIVGILYGFGAVSGVIGGLCVSLIRLRLSTRTILLLNLVLQAVGYLVVVTVQHPVSLIIMLTVTSFAGVVGNIIEISFRQIVTPRELLGRITGIFRFHGFGGMMIGAAIGGGIATMSGLFMPFIVAGATLIVSFIIFLFIIKPHMLVVVDKL